ncbi:hypothetical protein ASG52_17195 [Methylobacterium sp. Leaf456]|nr:hypothetical protein ASG52_17195 [Methylobacterium sp. Leaf456]
MADRGGHEAVTNGALVNALRVEPDLGTLAGGGLPGTISSSGCGTRIFRPAAVMNVSLRIRSLTAWTLEMHGRWRQPSSSWTCK